jgi:hypothetical protein
MSELDFSNVPRLTREQAAILTVYTGKACGPAEDARYLWAPRMTAGGSAPTDATINAEAWFRSIMAPNVFGEVDDWLPRYNRLVACNGMRINTAWARTDPHWRLRIQMAMYDETAGRSIDWVREDRDERVKVIARVSSIIRQPFPDSRTDPAKHWRQRLEMAVYEVNKGRSLNWAREDLNPRIQAVAVVDLFVKNLELPDAFFSWVEDVLSDQTPFVDPDDQLPE